MEKFQWYLFELFLACSLLLFHVSAVDDCVHICWFVVNETIVNDFFPLSQFIYNQLTVNS